VARYNLAALWGAAEPDFGSVAADLYQLPAVPDYQGLLASLEDTPDLNRYLSEARLHDSEARLALAGRSPGIRVGAGIRRLEEVNANAMVFSVSVPLAVFNRNQGSIAEAEALKAGAEETRAAEFIKSRNQLFGDYRELLDLRDQVTALRDRALPRMESALKNTEYAFERGRYSYLELTDAQQELLDLRGTLIDAAALYHLTRIEIERLTGAAVSP
jgi:cobalt-zinc-cadmium efflux system outer membrane protein